MKILLYIGKRIISLIITFFIILTIAFTLIKMLEPELPTMGLESKIELARREALGYNKPIMVQYGIFLRNVITRWEWGYSWKINYMTPVQQVLKDRMLITVLLNMYSIVLSIPIGILLGFFAAIKKNKLTDHVISVFIMIFISAPSFALAFLLQYTLGFKLKLFPITISSLYDVNGSWFSWLMLHSMILPILALSFKSIASLARFTRAELTEALTSEYMLLARSKGLSMNKAIATHAMKNAMVPILPHILGIFVSIVFGSIIIELIFAIPGMGQLYIQSILKRDYDVFIITSAFYIFISLSSMIIIDLSYGFLDPRIKMGEK